MGAANTLPDFRAEVTLAVTARERLQSSSRARLSKRALLARFELAAFYERPTASRISCSAALDMTDQEFFRKLF
jgi:hypothetical protein